jgi:hypothetical protein
VIKGQASVDTLNSGGAALGRYVLMEGMAPTPAPALVFAEGALRGRVIPKAVTKIGVFSTFFLDG